MQAFAAFREQGIEPVLIKGLAAALFYPDEKSRPAMDMDIAVSAVDYELGRRVAEMLAPVGYAVDLHRDLHRDPPPPAKSAKRSVPRAHLRVVK